MNWRQRYEAAYKSWFALTYPTAYADGHYSRPMWPTVSKSGGLMTMIENFCKWSGHHCERTNNMGVPIKKYAPKMNIMSGRVENIETGREFRRSAQLKGTSDMKGHINHPRYGLPVAIYPEIKIKRDTQSDHQVKYEEIIRKSGGFYTIIKTPDDWFRFYDYILSL